VKYCEKCGSPINDNSIFCSNCGEKVSDGNIEKYVDIETDDITNIKERSIALAIIFTILTCGIYSIYWMIKINDDSLKLAKEEGPSGGVVFLLTLITCGIYGYFWAYKMGKCVDKIKSNQSNVTGVLYVILVLFGLNIVNYALSQDAINNKIR